MSFGGVLAIVIMVSVAVACARLFILLWALVPPTLQDCPGIPSVLLEDYLASHSANFQAWNALVPDCGITGRWLGPNRVSNVGFTLDYGKVYHTDGFHLRNDPNGASEDRSLSLMVHTISPFQR